MPDIENQSTQENTITLSRKDELLAKWDPSWNAYIWYGTLPDFLVKWGLLGNHAMREHMEYEYIDTDQDGTYEVMFTTKNVAFDTDEELLSKLQQIR
jgi:hypothetical protein